MKKHQWLFTVPVVLLCFVVLFDSASKKVQKRNEEITQIHHAAESAIGDYLKGETIKAVSFNSLPIFHDQDRGIIGCRVLAVDESGVENRTGFDCLLRREKSIWKASIVMVDKNIPTPKETKKTAPWDRQFKPGPKGR